MLREIPVINPKTPLLQHFEFAVMNSIQALGTGASPAEISRHLSDIQERKVSIAQVYVALQRLESRKIVGHVTVLPAPQRGGRRRNIFHVKEDGKTAIEETRAFYSAVPK